jgi:hypothetical protein
MNELAPPEEEFRVRLRDLLIATRRQAFSA